MARLNPSRPPPPSSRTKKTIFSSSSESEPDSNNSDSDSEFPDIAALPPSRSSPKKKQVFPATTKKRASPPTESESASSSRNQTVIESATSPNAASSSVTGGVKRRKLLLGATFSDNVLFQKWTPTEEDAVLPAKRKKKRVLTENNNNPFGGLRRPLGMMHDEEGGEVGDMDSEAENPVVCRRKNMKVKEVKRVQDENETVTAKATGVRRTTEESLFSGRGSVLKEYGKATSRDTTEKAKEKEREQKKEKPPARPVQPSEQVTIKNNDMMEIDDEDRDLDIFEDLEDYAEASFHTACSMESSESEDGPTLKTTTARKGQNANTAVAAVSNSKDNDSDEEDLDDFFTRLSSKPKVPVVRESHLSPTKPRVTKNSRGRRMDMDATWTRERQSLKSRTLFDDEEEEERNERQRPARATKRKTASSNEEDEDTCGEEDVTQDFSCLQLESSSSSDPKESSETETEARQSRPSPATATRNRTRTSSPSSPTKLVPKLKPETASAQPTLPPSPKKLPRIPTTPHRPSSDLFWSREFVDDWNDEHSPNKKELFPSDSSLTTTKPPADSPIKKRARAPPSPQKLAAAQARESRLLRQSFDTHKHSLAVTFLSLLDTRLTSGRLSALTASTGGIKLIWSKTLNTTAGRANWKKESIVTRLPWSNTKQEGGSKEGEQEKKDVKHHASIELATKVLSTPERLFNTLAHEFCHLAVFMIDGVTTRPHGREFKCWAGRVNEEFGRHRGPLGSMVMEEGGSKGKWEGGYAVEVTTRHGYEIEFRYVWVCDGPAAASSASAGLAGAEGKGKEGKGGEEKKGGGCGTEYKRHSKSVDPSRHRCGICKGLLRQVKPAPRGGQGQQGVSSKPSSADGEQPGTGTQGGMGMGTNKIKEKAKQSEYQVFVKEQMKVVKAQKPGLAFGEVMKEVAERWKVEKVKRERERDREKKKKATPPTEVVGRKFSTLLEEVVADEDDDDDNNSPGVFEDEPMMDVVDLTADD